MESSFVSFHCIEHDIYYVNFNVTGINYIYIYIKFDLRNIIFIQMLRTLNARVFLIRENLIRGKKAESR